MTQTQLIELLTKIILISNVVVILGFVTYWTSISPWWKDSISRGLVWRDLLLISAEMPIIMSMFFQFSRLTSEVAAWIELGFLGMITPVMLLLTWEWFKERRKGGFP